VRGVFHAAGVVRFEALDTSSADALHSLVAAKVGGAWNLHELLAEEPLEFFVMCSSSSTLLASPLLGGYAAANAFLDALAWHRRALGRAALSVNWGTWGEVGMAVQSGHAGGLLTGMQVMDTARALASLQALLDQGETQAAVMPVDWAALAAAYPGFARDPFFEHLVDATAPGPEEADAARAIAARLREAPAAEQSMLLRRHLQHAAGRLLGIAADKLETGTPLSGMGFDSLMAVQLKNGIEAELGIVVPMIRLLQGPSVDELVPLLQDALGALPAPAPAATTGATVDWEEGTL
jgi:acyl carrier protein